MELFPTLQRAVTFTVSCVPAVGAEYEAQTETSEAIDVEQALLLKEHIGIDVPTVALKSLMSRLQGRHVQQLEKHGIPRPTLADGKWSYDPRILQVLDHWEIKMKIEIFDGETVEVAQNLSAAEFFSDAKYPSMAEAFNTLINDLIQRTDAALRRMLDKQDAQARQGTYWELEVTAIPDYCVRPKSDHPVIQRSAKSRPLSWDRFLEFVNAGYDPLAELLVLTYQDFSKLEYDFHEKHGLTELRVEDRVPTDEEFADYAAVASQQRLKLRLVDNTGAVYVSNVQYFIKDAILLGDNNFFGLQYERLREELTQTVALDNSHNPTFVEATRYVPVDELQKRRAEAPSSDGIKFTSLILPASALEHIKAN